MKKIFTSILVCLIMIAIIGLTGCSNDFAKQEYDSTEKIVQTSDRCSESKSAFKSIDGGYSLTVSKFDGRQTLWKKTLKDNTAMEIRLDLSISAGYAKVVFIDSDNNVDVLIECTQDTLTEQSATKTVSLTNGLNRIKIVGYDCEGLDLKMLFEEP